MAEVVLQDADVVAARSSRERPLAEVWNDRPYQDLRAAVLSERPAPWPCQHCGVRWSL
jgi:hypothetical protein